MWIKPDPRPGEPTMSVVICAYTLERADLLAAAVASVHAQTVPADEVIVVIDHSPELEHWARAALTGVEVVASDRPQGLAGARNAGVAAATRDVVAFLDDDAAAASDWVARLRSAYAAPGIIGVGGTVTADWSAGRPRWMPEEFDWVVGCTYRGMPATSGAVRNLIGANMSIRREAILAVGGFAEGMGRDRARPMGCEETDLCLRMARADPAGTILFDPAIRVRHHVGAGRATLRYFASRCYAEGLSKAEVVRRSGPRRGLASERAHVLRALPAGVLTALRERRPTRAATIAAGLGLTVSGYARGRVRS
ncbi:MAG: glucosyl-dolichyl phosphate glucuronosyltransferase [Solirubrobacteraceae bacterium]|nr:glucosyl-dolichyl phosphate glucuronosyltransferase [Solirubrobacteraceae bacterium]